MKQKQIQQTLIEELRFLNLPQDKKNELLSKMTEVLLKRIFLETMEKLDERSQMEYEKLIKNEEKIEKIEEFLKTKITDYDFLIQKIIDNFKKEMKNGF